MYGPIKYATLAAGATTTFNPIWLAPDNINNWQMTVVTTGTLTGTFTFEASNDPRARQTADPTNAQWTDVTAAKVQDISNPAGAGVNFVAINKAAIPWAGAFLRMKYTHTSGAGTIDAWFTGMSA